MSAMKDGGPAFPPPIAVGPAGDVYHTELPGMSLRDWFAGRALAAIVGKTPHIEFWTLESLRASDGWASAAAGAYLYADAMLAERENVRP